MARAAVINRGAFRLIERGEDLSPLMSAIGVAMEGSTVERFERGARLGDAARDVFTREIDCLTEKLRATTGEVVVRRPARGAAVGEYVGDGRRVCAAFPDEQGSRRDHAFTRTGHPHPSVKICM